jgi:hypothetical protein
MRFTKILRTCHLKVAAADSCLDARTRDFEASTSTKKAHFQIQDAHLRLAAALCPTHSGLVKPNGS